MQNSPVSISEQSYSPVTSSTILTNVPTTARDLTALVVYVTALWSVRRLASAQRAYVRIDAFTVTATRHTMTVVV